MNKYKYEDIMSYSAFCRDVVLGKNSVRLIIGKNYNYHARMCMHSHSLKEPCELII